MNRLESRQRRGDSDVTIVTQCSCSRLSRLERMCSLWSGVLSVAIIAEGGGRVGRRMRRMASALHERVEGKTRCRLDICLCQPAPGPAARDGLYPVNALRNVALGAAKTDLVLLLVRKELRKEPYVCMFACAASERFCIQVSVPGGCCNLRNPSLIKDPVF